jgi:hypothetical protein
MIIHKKHITIFEKRHDDNDFTNLNLAIIYARYRNNFNIICEYIELEDINFKI